MAMGVCVCVVCVGAEGRGLPVVPGLLSTLVVMKLIKRALLKLLACFGDWRLFPLSEIPAGNGDTREKSHRLLWERPLSQREGAPLPASAPACLLSSLHPFTMVLASSGLPTPSGPTPQHPFSGFFFLSFPFLLTSLLPLLFPSLHFTQKEDACGINLSFSYSYCCSSPLRALRNVCFLECLLFLETIIYLMFVDG